MSAYPELERAAVIKAAYAVTRRGNAAKAVERSRIDAELLGMGQIAADVIGAAMSPYGFILAVREAVTAHPLSIGVATDREKAAATREAWESDVYTEWQNRVV